MIIKSERGKKSLLFKRLSILGLAAATVGAGGVSLARYYKEAEAESETGRIAKFGVVITVNDGTSFSKQYDGEESCYAKSTVKVLAPGTGGQLPEFAIDSTNREVAVSITVEYDIIYDMNWKILNEDGDAVDEDSKPIASADRVGYYTPITFSGKIFTGVTKLEKTHKTYNSLIQAEEEDGYQVYYVIEKDYYMPESDTDADNIIPSSITGSWSWNDEETVDGADTVIGDEGKASVSIEAYITIEQITLPVTEE